MDLETFFFTIKTKTSSQKSIAYFIYGLFISLLAANELFKLHQLNILHNDIKCENYAVTPNLRNWGESNCALIDFGHAEELSRDSGKLSCGKENSSRWGNIRGTILYAAPEVISFTELPVNARTADSNPYNTTTDIYSFGSSIIHELFTIASALCTSESIKQYAHGLSMIKNELVQLDKLCCNKDAMLRPALSIVIATLNSLFQFSLQQFYTQEDQKKYLSTINPLLSKAFPATLYPSDPQEILEFFIGRQLQNKKNITARLLLCYHFYLFDKKFPQNDIHALKATLEIIWQDDATVNVIAYLLKFDLTPPKDFSLLITEPGITAILRSIMLKHASEQKRLGTHEQTTQPLSTQPQKTTPNFFPTLSAQVKKYFNKPNPDYDRASLTAFNAELNNYSTPTP